MPEMYPGESRSALDLPPIQNFLHACHCAVTTAADNAVFLDNVVSPQNNLNAV